jgi:long-chain acyl-CoA synthetase
VSASLASLLETAAGRHAERPFLVVEGTSVSYAAAGDAATRAAAALRARGVGPGDRVAVLLPNTLSFVAAYFGALRLGAIVVPLNPLLRDPEIDWRLEHSGARVLVAAPERGGVATRRGVELVEPGALEARPPADGIASVRADDPAVLLYTSGTSGDPKAAVLTHGNLRWAAEYTAGPLLGLSPDDVVLGAPPLSHVFGQTVAMNASIAAGARVALTTRFEAEAALELMVRTSTTVFLGVPTMCIALLQAARKAPELPRLRITHAGAAPFAVEVLEAFTAMFGCPLLEGYGMTETSAVIATHHLGQPTKPGSVGTPVEGAEMRLVDLRGEDVPIGEIGEVLVRSPGLMRGYWQNPAATRAAIDEDGWFATGDVGYRDSDGYLFLVDRKKDTILRGGYSVYPREVEEALYQHPAVAEAAVVGVPDARLGEEVVAVVVARPGAIADPDEIGAFVRERVAAYKYPRLVVVADELPRGPSGKILKRAIDRAELARRLAESMAEAS